MNDDIQSKGLGFKQYVNGYIVIFEERMLVRLEENFVKSSEGNIFAKKRELLGVVCLHLAKGKFATY